MKGPVSLLRCHVQVDDGVAGDQVGGVGPLVGVQGGVMHDLLLGERVRLQLLVQLLTISVIKC